jgi:hypothetical protein
MKVFDQKLFDKLVNKELEPYGVTVSDVRNIPDWYITYTMTKAEEKVFMDWAFVEIKTYLKCNNKMVKESLNWFILGWGLRTT